ncbi:MAG: hypothetical protein IT305_31895 [Chloroflexi bacterium]|nr:hypothetical protein [Chloroflexota bacterium]
METLPVDDLAVVWQHRAQWQLRRCFEGSLFYRERIAAAGIDAGRLRGLDDLRTLPFLTDDELRAEAASSPPPGRVTVAPAIWWAEQDRLANDGETVVWTDGDLIHRAGVAARALWVASARPSSPRYVRRPLGDDMLDATLDAAFRRIDAAAGQTSFATLVVIGARTPATNGTGFGSDALGGSAVCWFVDTPAPARASSNEPLRCFGLARVGPTLAYECEARAGLHWTEDQLYVEIVDPASGQPVTSGPGALVLTHLTREGSPLLRYWTGYETEIDRTPCPCGRSGARSSRITRRC